MQFELNEQHRMIRDMARDFATKEIVPIAAEIDEHYFGANVLWQLAQWCQNNGMLLHIHRAMHAVIDRNPHHGIHFRVLTKILRLSGGDHLHTGTVVVIQRLWHKCHGMTVLVSHIFKNIFKPHELI